MDDTSRSVEETKQLAERAFYFSKRLPKLLHWQTDAALEDLLAKPDLNQVLQDVSQTSGSIDRVSKVIERVPELVAAERKAFLAAWDARQNEAFSTLKEIRAMLAEGKEFAAQVRGASQAIEQARVRSRAEGSKPFDIAEYTTAAAEIAQMARDATALVGDGHSLLASPAWTARQEDVTRLANDTLGRAELGSRRLVNHLASRLVQVLFVFFILLALYRVIVRQIEGNRIARTPPLPETKEHRSSPVVRRL